MNCYSCIVRDTVYIQYKVQVKGRVRVVGVVTCYGMDVRGSNPDKGRFSAPVQTTLDPTHPPEHWTPGHSGCKAVGAWL